VSRVLLQGLVDQVHAMLTLTFGQFMSRPLVAAAGRTFAFSFLLITISLFNYKNSWPTKLVPLTFIGRFAVAPFAQNSGEFQNSVIPLL